MMFEDPPFIGDWYREQKLGSGGFGVVMLWKNKKTGQYVAIKKCHIFSQDDGTEKQIERWNREVEYMTNEINHENIVRGLKIQPDSFVIELNKANPSIMPVLIMEYCEGGDLRRFLNMNTSTSGLNESEVRNILKCVRNAISYLHELKITHRDIKPENIVIKTINSDTKVYKLTDLGYAKALDRQSLQASLVGTMEYVAPELLHSDKYSCTVDYWSFGIIAFEIITGLRPFVPHMPLTQWMLTVNKKTSEHICITEDMNGIHYLNKIHPENHITECLSNHMEQWLRLALEWNPKQRGYVFESTHSISNSANIAGPAPVHVLKLFTMLNDILNKKILSAFCLYTCEHLSYELDEHITMDSLLTVIENDTLIPKDKIRLTISLENSKLNKIDVDTKPSDLYIDDYFDKPMVYISMIGTSMKSDNKVKIPKRLQDIFQDPKQKMKPHVFKLFAYNTYYYIRSEQKKYTECLTGFYTLSLQLSHEIELVEKDVNLMIKSIYGVNGAMKLYESTILRTKENMETEYPEQISQSYTFWMDQYAKMATNINALVGAGEKILIRHKSVLRRIRDAFKDKMFNKISQDYYDVHDLDKKFDITRAQIANKIHVDNRDLIICVYNCMKRRDQLLRNEEFLKWQSNTFAIEIEMEEIKKTIEMAAIQAEKYQNDIYNFNNNLLENICQMKRTKTLNSAETKAEYMPDIAAIMENMTEAAAKPATKPDFHIGKTVTDDLKSKYGSDIYCFGEGEDTISLIEDNENLRDTMEGLIKDIEMEFGYTI